MSDINPMRQRVVDYLDKFGLDAGEISKDGWDNDGFYLVRKGADPTVLHPWPDGFSPSWLAGLTLAAEREDIRLGRM